MIKQIIIFIISMLAGIWTASANKHEIITVEKTGSGKPMILIHGMSCSAGIWDEVADHYKSGYEIHLVSISGFGNPQPVDSHHILKSVKDELISYVKSNNLQKTILMGHSMGGFLSLWAAIEEPELFSIIISVDGLPYYPVLAMPGITPETAQPFVEMMKNQMTGQTPEMRKISQEMIVASMIGNEKYRPRVVEMGLNSNPDVIARAMGEMYTTDLRNDVHNINIPVLALGSWYAYRDYGVTMESSSAAYKAQFNRIPGAKFKMAETALHFIFYDDPEWFFSKVDAFLDSGEPELGSKED
jgi:pimeloyl-ACP methyl ester carboxylesterase